jgi:pyruvate ferredoxin oxidoreductase gamma subunit
MFQIRIHGRGGQGVVTAAELLSVAAFLEGRHAQAFPSFGSERMGAPVMAFCRIDDRAIRLREPVLQPDALIVQDRTLLHQVDLFNGLPTGGVVLLNTSRDLASLGLDDLMHGPRKIQVHVLPATLIAMRHVGRPLPNAVLLGGFAAISGVVKLESIAAALREKFPAAVAERNIAAATEAAEMILKAREAAHA